MKRKFEVKITALEKVIRRKPDRDETFYILKAKDEEGTEVVTITSAEQFETFNPGEIIIVSIDNPQQKLKK